MVNTKTLLFFFLALLLSFHACECGKGKDIPDVSKVVADVEIKRFEQDLFNLDTNNLDLELQQLETKYPIFSELYFSQVLGSTDSLIAPEGHTAYVKGFISHPSPLKLYDTCMVVFPDLKWLESDFEQAFRFFKYYFPEQPFSGEVVSYISEYTLGGFLYGNNSIGIGLEFYLGSSYPYQLYNPMNPNFSQYLTRTFNKDHIVSKSMTMLTEDLLGAPQGNRLIDHMIHNGKKLYILDKLLPNTADTIKLEFTVDQLEWCRDNEANIWAFFLTENLLYNSDWNNFRKYVEHSPNSPGMPDEAPGRTANWLGLQIVNAYMRKQPKTSLQELAALKDAQTIMDKSKYKPAR